MFRLDEQTRLSYTFLLKWMLLSILSGIVGAGVVRGFHLLVSTMTGRLALAGLPIFVWPLGGALVAGGLIYRIEPNAAGEGIPSYIRGIRVDKGNLGFSVTFYKFWAALATLSTFGNGGVVGPLGRVCAGMISTLEHRLAGLHAAFGQEDRRTASLCGLAAAVGAIFHSSIGGGIFAVEVIQRSKMGYKDLFPAILSSSTAVFVCKAVGWPSFYRLDAVDRFMDIGKIGPLLLLVLIVGFAGGAFTALYRFITRIINRQKGNVLLKVLGGSLAASLIARAINPALLGTSKDLIAGVFDGNWAQCSGRLTPLVPTAIALVIMAVAKALCNCITVGSGMSAGFTGPAALIGMMLGSAAAVVAGVPPSSATYYALVAAGFSGMLASSMNIPLAASVMTTEIFGLQYGFPGGLAAIVGFQVTRHQTIYDYALAGAGLAVDED